MRKLILILCLMLIVLSLQGFSISAGYGALHGGLGVKGVIGMGMHGDKKSNDTGFIIGFGTLLDEPMFEFGFQYATDNNYYAAFATGGIGVQTEWISWGGTGETKVIDGFSVLVGRTIDLDSKKHWMINLDVGYSWGKTTFFEDTSWEYEYELKTFTFDIGIGYKFWM